MYINVPRSFKKITQLFYYINNINDYIYIYNVEQITALARNDIFGLNWICYGPKRDILDY